MKRWMTMLIALLCVLAMTACAAQNLPEEPPERNTVTITVPEGVAEATVCVPDGQERYLCRYTGKEAVTSLIALLKQVGERPEVPEENGPYAGHVYEITLFCADDSEEKYFWSGSHVRQGEGFWCELPYEKDGWLEPWLGAHEPDEITKLN